MSYLNSVEKATQYIEANIREAGLSVALVCDEVPISRWHFQRVFSAVTGNSIGDYLKKRRLSLAAEDLVNTDQKILQIAFDYGFESQEAFTRAFKKFFQLTPAQLRKQQDPKTFMHKYELNRDFLKHLKEKIVMEPKIENMKELKLVGFSAPFVGVFDDDSNSSDVIPKLWQKLMQSYAKIPNKTDENLYGVIKCGFDESEDSLLYKAMVEVESFDNISPEFDKFTFPEGKLAKFTHKGSPAGIDKTLKYILGTWLPQSKERAREGLELEIYPPDYNPQDSSSSFEYCLAIH